MEHKTIFESARDVLSGKVILEGDIMGDEWEDDLRVVVKAFGEMENFNKIKTALPKANKDLLDFVLVLTTALSQEPTLLKTIAKSYLGEETIAESGMGYVEAMGDDFDKGVKLIATSWTKWKKGPMTEEEDIRPARREVSSFITTKLA